MPHHSLCLQSFQARAEFDGLVGACGQMLTPEEQAHMEELRAYVVEDEGSWALGENFSILFTRILHDPAIPDQARLHLVRIMAAAALKDDVILLLHQDRRDHTIMNYANRVESLPPQHQEALALFVSLYSLYFLILSLYFICHPQIVCTTN